MTTIEMSTQETTRLEDVKKIEDFLLMYDSQIFTEYNEGVQRGLRIAAEIIRQSMSSNTNSVCPRPPSTKTETAAREKQDGVIRKLETFLECTSRLDTMLAFTGGSRSS